jgi:hypothetical protein
MIQLQDEEHSLAIRAVFVYMGRAALELDAAEYKRAKALVVEMRAAFNLIPMRDEEMLHHAVQQYLRRA